MAALRIAQPGTAVRHIDLGPSYGRAQRPTYGGELVTARKAPPVLSQATTPVRRAQMAEYRARITNPCRRLLKTGALCARTSGHGGEHQSPEALRKQTLRRRAGKAMTIHPERRRPEGYHWPPEDAA